MIFRAPGNFKSGRFIFGLFRWVDLVLAVTGVSLTLILILIYMNGFDGSNPYLIVLLLMPGILSVMLVCPAGPYHNILTFIRAVITYIRSKKTYIYEGVYFYDAKEER